MLKWIFVLTLLMMQQACFNVATTGAQVVYNRRSIQESMNDQYITLQVHQAVNANKKEFSECNIAITTQHGRVLLVGQVQNHFQKNKMEQMTRRIPNVEEVYNLLAISNSSSTLKRISDVWLTTKVKAKLIASNDVDATQIKVMTENGTVYLMGILPKDEAEMAVDIASDTEGVESVVKIFSYLHITKS